MKFIEKVKVFLLQFCSPLIYILILAGAISFYFGEYIDGWIIFGVIFINALIGAIQEIRADEALEALKKMSSPHSIVKRNGEVIKVLSSDVLVGDILMLEEGSIISADGLIIASNGLQIDESSLTGESLRIEKSIDNPNVYESTVVVSGHGEVLVQKVGKDTEFGKISSAIKKQKEITPLQIKLNNLSKVIGVVTLLVCILIFLINIFRGEEIIQTLINSIFAYSSILVIVIFVILNIVFYALV